MVIDDVEIEGEQKKGIFHEDLDGTFMGKTSAQSAIMEG